MALPTSTELVRQFVTDANGLTTTVFNDPNTGVNVPAESLPDYYNGTYTPEQYSDGLPQTSTTSLGGLSQSQVQQGARPLPTNPEEYFPSKGSGTEHSTEGDTSPRSQSNNFGYVNDLPGTGIASTVLGMVNPALGLAAKGATSLINNNNALAVSSARQSIGLDPLSGVSIAQKTFSGTAKGKVGDVSIGDQKYTVGLEAADSEGRTTLTPEEARRRSSALGQPIKETENRSALGQGVLDVAGKVAGGMLPGPVKAGVGLLGAATKKAPEGFQDQGIAGNLMNAGRQKLGLTPRLTPNDPKPVNTSPLTLGAPQQAPVESRPLSALGEQNDSTGLGKPKSSVPSFDSLSSSPGMAKSGMMRNASLTSEASPRDNSTGLAGITTSGRFGSVDSMDRSNLDPSINKALDAIGGVAPGLGINSGYRDPARNAAAGGAKRSQHMEGKAVDINISGLSDDQKRDALEAAVQNGVKGVGIYSSGRTLHIDTREGGLKTWGANPKNEYAGVDISQQPSWAQDTLKATQGAGIYSPGPRIGPTVKTRQEALSEPTQEQKTKNTLASLEGKDLSQYSSGRLASMGFAPSMSAQEVGAVSRMIAGEVSPNTLKGLARSDPKAIAEVGNIASTALNRASQVGWDKTLTPNQYNSLSPKNKAVTDSNYSKFGSAIQDAVRSSLTGESPAPNPDSTHYANMSTSNPSWGRSMTNVSVQNEHTFGNVNREYGGVAKTSAAKSQASRAQQAVADAAASNLNSKAGQNLSFNDQRADKAASAAASAAQARSESTKTSGLGAKKSDKSTTSTASNSTTSSSPSKSTSSSSSSSGSSKGSGSGNSGSGVGSKSTSNSNSKSTSSKSASNSSSSSNSKSSGSSSSKSGSSKSDSKKS